MILTASARLQSQVNPYAWAGVMALVAVGILAVLSANLLTLMLTWTAIDVIELLILQANSSDRTLGIQTVIAFAVRVTGTVMVMVAALISKRQVLPPTFSPAARVERPAAAAGVRAAPGRAAAQPGQHPGHHHAARFGHQPAHGGGGLQPDGAGAPAAQLVPSAFAGPLLALTALAGSVQRRGLVERAGRNPGRPYWLIALAGLAVASVIQGQPRASLAWGALCILPGSLIFLYSARRRSILYLPVLGCWASPGCPSPRRSAGGRRADRAIQFLEVLFIVVACPLDAGLLRFCSGPGEDLAHMERWVQAVYPVGLAVLVLGSGFTGLGWPGSFSGGVWWAGLASVVLAVLGVLLPLAGRRTGLRNALNRWNAGRVSAPATS